MCALVEFVVSPVVCHVSFFGACERAVCVALYLCVATSVRCVLIGGECGL